METGQQISLATAILINVNIMLGAGMFINTTVLAQQAGVLGAFSYLIIGVLMLPLIVSIATLLQLHPAGGFYAFGRNEISPFAGFISTWSYIIAKLASAMLMMHTSVLFAQQIVPALGAYNPLVIDAVIVTLFSVLNLQNMQTGGNIQLVFMVFKLIPITFALLACATLFAPSHITLPHMQWEGLGATLPLVLYATIGFEAACSLGSRIKVAHKNAARAVLISYGIVIVIASTYQFLFYGALGSTLAALPDYRGAFPALVAQLLPTAPHLSARAIQLLHIAIASSALGGSYGILYSNNWNIYTLAQHKHIFFSSLLTQLNKNAIPWACLLVEWLICMLYLVVVQGSQLPLQQISALGCVLAYSISVLALACAKWYKPHTPVSWFIPLLGLGNCALLITSCVYHVMHSGITTFGVFCGMLLSGACMFWWQD